MQDFEPPIDNATETDPFGEYAPPQEESHAPQEPYTPPPQPPVQPNSYDDYPWLDSVEDIHDYTRKLTAEIGKETAQMLADRRLYERVESAEERARQVHDGRDGLPGYDEVVDGFAVPIMRQRQDIRQLVLAQSDPSAAAYLIGFCAKYPNLAQEVLRRNGRLDSSIFRSIHFRKTVQGKNSGRRQPSGRLTAAEINAMSPLDFETQVLDPFKMSSVAE
jgi:hypothetical protein